MIKNHFRIPVVLGVAALSVASCSDYEAGITSDTFKLKKYAEKFEEAFGTPDPNQDWSMAANVQASVTVGSNPSAVIYSEKPGYAGSIVLGLVNGKSATINAIKGAEQIYAVVTENGKTIASGYYDVVNGAVVISDQPVAKRAAQTRADGDPTLGVKLFTHVAWDAEAAWDGKTRQFANNNHDAKAYIAKEGGEYYVYYAPNLTSEPKKIIHNWVSPGDHYTPVPGTIDYTGIVGLYAGSNLKFEDGTDCEGIYWPNLVKWETDADGNLELVFLSSIANYVTKQHYDAPYYRISDTKTTDTEWVSGDCKTLFWEGDACFLESQDYRHTRKQAVYAEYGTNVAGLSKGVEFTTVRNGQNINIPMMYGATVKKNVFGYYYYTDGQDPRAVNRYVLFDDARPSTNIKLNGTAVSGMQLASPTANNDDVITCVTRRLVYFGEDGKGTDGNGTGTFDFPAGVHIGFFIMKEYADGDNWSGLDGATAHESWSYSTASLNQKYFNNAAGPNQTLKDFWGYRYASPEYTDLDSSTNPFGTPGVNGRVKAITWKYNDRILVGFGDDSGDEDLNDFVFWYDSEVDPDEEPEINITTSDKETSWIFACEDLGGTFDYDFNDIVWEVAQKYEETKENGVVTSTTYGNIEIRLLAAGGQLPVELVYNNESLGEVHQQLAGQAESAIYSPVNVAAPKASVSAKVVKTIQTTSQMNINEMKSLFKVKVSGKDGEAYYVTAPDASEHNSGNAKPQMILLPATWEWPIENKCIKDAYPDFTNWANDATANDWLSNKTSNAWYVKKK